jgi:hypothetical protein
MARFADRVLQPDKPLQPTSGADPRPSYPLRRDSINNIVLVKDLHDAFGRGDIPAVIGAMSEATKWYKRRAAPTCPAERPGWGPDPGLMPRITEKRHETRLQQYGDMAKLQDVVGAK